MSSSSKPLRHGQSHRSLNHGSSSEGDIERDAEICEGHVEKDVRSAQSHRQTFSLEGDSPPREEEATDEEKGATASQQQQQCPRVRTGSQGSCRSASPLGTTAGASMMQRASTSLGEHPYSTFHERSVDSQLSASGRRRCPMPATPDSQRRPLVLAPPMPMVTYERQVEIER